MPDRLVDCGLLLALSLTSRVPVAAPVVLDENVTLKVHLFLLFSVVEQVDAETEKGLATAYSVPVSVVPKLFFSVNLCAALLTKARFLGTDPAWWSSVTICVTLLLRFARHAVVTSQTRFISASLARRLFA